MPDEKHYTEISACRICDNRSLLPVLSLGTQTLTGVFPKSRAQRVSSGPVDLVRCDAREPNACGLVQLKQTYSAQEMYGENYGYLSSLNPSMVRHLGGIVEWIRERVSVGAGDVVVDIGSNDGTMLGKYPRGPQFVGVDPLARKFESGYPAGSILVPEFFSPRAVRERVGRRQAKVVTSISMYYDLDRPLQFMHEVRELLADDGVWVLEQSYLPTMLERTAYDTICHEHLEYYSLTQLQWMAERAGLQVLEAELNATNGGSFLISLGVRGGPYRPDAAGLARLLDAERGLRTAAPFDAFADSVVSHRDRLRELIDEAKRSGRRLAGYGASTKGNVVLQYCGLSEADLPCIGEVNRDKLGAFTPGTLIPIRPEADVRREFDTLLVLPWHFREFIVDKEAGFLRGGGSLCFPLPEPEFVRAAEPQAARG